MKIYNRNYRPFHFNLIRELICVFFIFAAHQLSAQGVAPNSQITQSIYQSFTVNSLTGKQTNYMYGVNPSYQPYAGHEWNGTDYNPTYTYRYRVVKADYGSLTNATINHVEFKGKYHKISTGDSVAIDVYLYAGDLIANNTPEQEIKSISGGQFVKHIGTNSTKDVSFDITIPDIYFRNMPGTTFCIVMQMNNYCCKNGLEDFNQVVTVSSESVLRYATGPCSYYLPDRGFLFNDSGSPTKYGVPVVCLGTSSWGVWANTTPVGGCTSFAGIPLVNQQLGMTVYKCNYDLTRQSSTPGGEWWQTINTGTATDVTYFDFKVNMPQNLHDSYFQPDGVYELWLWKTSDPTNAAKRYFHVWTDNGAISNVPSYSVNLRAGAITITNSTVQSIGRIACIRQQKPPSRDATRGSGSPKAS